MPAWMVAGLLALVTLAVYWRTTQFDFINFDDKQYITDNPRLLEGLTWDNVRWYFGHFYFSNWHPVTSLSYLLDFELWGLKPFGFHLTNILLHALNTALVFLVLRELMGGSAPSPRPSPPKGAREENAEKSSAGSKASPASAEREKYSPRSLEANHYQMWACALVAALFGLHPLHVESVAWVAERKDVLSGCFGLLTLWAYARYARRGGEKDGACFESNGPISPKGSEGGKLDLPTGCRQHAGRGFYWLALGCFALGLMSKPMLVTWPFVLLLLDFWPLRRFTIDDLRLTILKPLLLEKIPFFALAAASSVVTYLAQQQSGAVVAAEDYPLGDRAGNAVVSYGRYLGKTFWPSDLAVLYPHPGEWPMKLVLLATAVLGVISWWCWRQRRQQPFWLTGWLWFLGTLVPVIGLVQAGKQAMADRYMYLPLLGALIAVVWGALELTAQLRQRKVILTTTGFALIALCAGVTWKQLGYWKDSVTIYQHTLAVTTNNAVIHYNLGTTLCEAGKLDEAIEQFQEAIRIKPNFVGPRNNLAVVLVDLGRLDEAIGQYTEALRLEPDNADTHFNLAVAYFRKGQLDEALGQFQEAARLAPEDSEIQARLRLIAGLQQAVGRSAADPGALNNIAWELATSPSAAVRSGGLAVQLAERACELTQRQVTVMLGTLAAAYAEAGRFDDAVATADQACALAKKNGETELLKRNEELRELYQKHQPYREGSLNR